MKTERGPAPLAKLRAPRLVDPAQIGGVRISFRSKTFGNGIRRRDDRGNGTMSRRRDLSRIHGGGITGGGGGMMGVSNRIDNEISRKTGISSRTEMKICTGRIVASVVFIVGINKIGDITISDVSLSQSYVGN